MIGGSLSDLDQYKGVPLTSAAPIAYLTVSDIERLAKAGVKMELGTIFPQTDIPDMPPKPEWPCSLEEAFWQRWQRARPRMGTYARMLAETPPPYQIHAHEYGGKVYVMVCPHGAAPLIIEDDSPLYPSDALMAKLALYERTQP